MATSLTEPKVAQTDHSDESEAPATFGSAALSALVARAEVLGGGAAPVERWNPPDCGPIPMRIDRNGRWHYLGSPINRERLVTLFSRILRREADGSFVLVTPHEKVTIAVDDAPFTGVELAVDGIGDAKTLVVRTNVGDVVRVGAQHPLRFAAQAKTGGLLPYVTVRGGLEARLTRAAAYELAEYMDEVDGQMGVRSGGVVFRVPNEATQ